jgi:hypothetical protein
MSHSHGSHNTSDDSVPESPSRMENCCIYVPCLYVGQRCISDAFLLVMSPLCCVIKSLTQGDHTSNLRLPGSFIFSSSRFPGSYQVYFVSVLGSSPPSLPVYVVCLCYLHKYHYVVCLFLPYSLFERLSICQQSFTTVSLWRADHF